jgi:hypothetical protein
MRRILSITPSVLTVRDLSNQLPERSSSHRLSPNKARQLPAFKIGKDWRLNVEEIDRWCLQRSTKHDTQRPNPPNVVRDPVKRSGSTSLRRSGLILAVPDWRLAVTPAALMPT